MKVKASIYTSNLSCSHQFYNRVFIESELIVILCGVELLVGRSKSTTTDKVYLSVCTSVYMRGGGVIQYYIFSPSSITLSSTIHNY